MRQVVHRAAMSAVLAVGSMGGKNAGTKNSGSTKPGLIIQQTIRNRLAQECKKKKKRILPQLAINVLLES